MIQAYAQSKRADLIFSLELQWPLKAVGSPILSIAAHPGYAVTNLQADHVGPGLKILMATMKPFLSQDADGSVAKRLWVESERLTGVKFAALSDVVDRIPATNPLSL